MARNSIADIRVSGIVYVNTIVLVVHRRRTVRGQSDIITDDDIIVVRGDMNTVSTIAADDIASGGCPVADKIGCRFEVDAVKISKRCLAGHVRSDIVVQDFVQPRELPLDTDTDVVAGNDVPLKRAHPADRISQSAVANVHAISAADGGGTCKISSEKIALDMIIIRTGSVDQYARTVSGNTVHMLEIEPADHVFSRKYLECSGAEIIEPVEDEIGTTVVVPIGIDDGERIRQLDR